MQRDGQGRRAGDVVRAVRAAPWQAAAPLALVVIAVICTGLVVADAGGWSHTVPGSQLGYYTYGDDGLETLGSAAMGLLPDQLSTRLALNGAWYFVVLAALLTSAALAGWRWLTVSLLAALSIVLTGWTANQGHLGYHTVVFRPAPNERKWASQIETSITIGGVAGLLLFVGLLVALAWAVTGTLDRRRSTQADRAARRRPWRTSVLIGIAALAITLVAPRAANVLAHAANDLVGVPTDSDFSEGGQQTMYLLFAAIAATYVGALVLPRRRPAGAVALVLVGSALWIPIVWMFGGILAIDVLGGVIDEGLSALLMYPLAAIGGILASAWIVARASQQAPPTATGA